VPAMHEDDVRAEVLRQGSYARGVPEAQQERSRVPENAVRGQRHRRHTNETRQRDGTAA